jgi:hypothetical protein
MQVKPVDKTVKEVLETGFYQIPRYQRPYSWDKEQVDDLWTDAIASDDPDYFIGSFVLHRPNNQTDTFSVVDGQQRLTTITLLLAAIRNSLKDLGRAPLADAVQKLIERPDINSKQTFVLQTETSYPYLHEYIQKAGAPQLPASEGREEAALRAAFEYLTARVGDTVASVDADPSLSPAKRVAEKEKKLVRLRNNVLRLQLIIVELTNEDDAYLIFETLNTRGKDLGIADLIKNLLTRHLKSQTQGVDVAKDKWAGILDLFDSSVALNDINSFIYHAWLSRQPYVGKDKLFREVKKGVEKSSAMTYLDELVKDSQIYRTIFEPAAHKWSNQELDIKASLDALNVFRVVQPVPMILALMRGYWDKKLTMSQLRKMLRDMENFHVQFTAVTAQRTGGGTARMYAASAEELGAASDTNARAKVLTAFRTKMRERIPAFGDFEANFLEIEYRTENTKQKSLVQYLLRRLHAHSWSGVPVDYSQMSIEHIAPENPPAGPPDPEVGQLGNLLLMPQPGNSNLGNAPFAQKKAAFITSGIQLDPELAAATSWSSTEIEARTRWIAKQAYDVIFKV